MLKVVKISSINKAPDINQPLCQSLNFGFGNNKNGSKTDTFEKENVPPQQKSNSNILMTLLAGASVSLLALTRYKCGLILKSMGEETPFFTFQRLAKIKNLASKDKMTGLFNKNYLTASITKDYNKALKSGKNFSVAMLDMDNFKAVNEVFGHGVGDIVIGRIGENVKKVTKKYGAKGFRAGGEEFIITIADKDSATAKRIIEEIAESIKKDETIQKYLPEFQQKANSDIEFLSSKINTINDSVFPKLKGQQKVKNYKQLADDITSLIETYVEKYDPADKVIFNEIVHKIKNAPEKDLHKFFKISTKVDEQYTLGNELNKIYTHYTETINDLYKWTHHLKEHGKFTVSGGLVNIKESKEIKDGMCMIKIADEALKSAKEKGKNTVITASDDIIKRIVAKSDKNKT